jgi:hypothetical protein
MNDFVMVNPGSDGPEPTPPEYEPVGLHRYDDSEMDDWPEPADEDWGECDE